MKHDKPYSGWSRFNTGKWLVVGVWCAMMVGCMAQQADVVRIKRELDAKITQLDKSKTSLQQAVQDANDALGQANRLIAKQRAEIQELLHARAELMDQMATLKDTDLSQIRGVVERNQHEVGELDRKLTGLVTQIEAVRSEVHQAEDRLQPVVQQFQKRLGTEEELLTEQRGKLGEFRNSLVDYQEVLTALRQQVTQQGQQVVSLQRYVEQLNQQEQAGRQHLGAQLDAVDRKVQTMMGTMEQVGTKLGERIDAHEQQLSQVTTSKAVALPTPSGHSLMADTSKASPSRPQPPPASSLNLPSSYSGSREMVSPYKGGITRPVPTSPLSSSTSASLHQGSSVNPNRSVLQTETTQGDRAAYQMAFNALRGKDFQRAASEFSQFLQSYPSSRYAANSQYWLGECYYGQRRFQEAIDEFERVFAFYPTSNKVPASLLKIGYAHLELGHPAMARSVFQQLVRTYPQSNEAIKAHGRLQEVNALLHNPS